MSLPELIQDALDDVSLSILVVFGKKLTTHAALVRPKFSQPQRPSIEHLRKVIGGSLCINRCGSFSHLANLP